MAEVIEARTDVGQGSARRGQSTGSLPRDGAEQDLACHLPAPASIRLLGFVPLSGLDPLVMALNTIAGPLVEAHRGPALAALVQAESSIPLLSRNRVDIAAGLLAVQRRLEVACEAGPFLPMDPAAACCAADALASMLTSAWSALAAALAQHGRGQQWDIILRWRAEPIVARNRDALAAAAPFGPQALAESIQAVLRADRNRREVALLQVLAPVVDATATNGAAGTDTDLCLTVLVTAGRDAAVEAALDSLDAEYTEDTTIDMRGPLPSVSFSSVRVANDASQPVQEAWQALDLPGRVDRATLHRHWRRRAAAAHPDRGAGATDTTISDLTAANHLLRGLLPGQGFATLADLLAKAGPRLVTPSTGTALDLEAGR